MLFMNIRPIILLLALVSAVVIGCSAAPTPVPAPSGPSITIVNFGKAIQLDPDDAYAYNNSGLAYHELGQYERAIKGYDQAIQLDPDYAEAYFNRGAAYHNLGGRFGSPVWRKGDADKTKACSLDSKPAAVSKICERP